MNSNRSLREASAASSQYADEAADAASHALESTRQFANQAFEKAGQKVRDLRSGVQDIASRGMSTVSDATVAAQERLGRAAQATTRYVAEEPVKAALIAAAVGAAVAALVIALRRERRPY